MIVVKLWEEEDRSLTTTEVTKRCISRSINGIKEFLRFTMETCEDEGFGGWLPTLDTSLRVNEELNTVEYRFYEKATTNRRCIQASSAMNHNTKVQILSNDLVRRMFNMKEGLGPKMIGSTVDKYASKIRRSGYSLEQTKRIILNGIKSFEAVRKKRLERFGTLRRTATISSLSRRKNKLLGKTNWFRTKKNKARYDSGKKSGKKSGEDDDREEVRTVLFCEYTKHSVLEGTLNKRNSSRYGTRWNLNHLPWGPKRNIPLNRRSKEST